MLPDLNNDNTIRDTKEWKDLYEKYLQQAKKIKASSPQERKTLYMNKIDEIYNKTYKASSQPLNQKQTTPPQQTEKQETPSIRNTKRWKKLYSKNLQSVEAMRGTKKQKEEAYLKWIDRLASAPPVDNNNIMSGFGKFASPDFKWTSDNDEDDDYYE